MLLSNAVTQVQMHLFSSFLLSFLDDDTDLTKAPKCREDGFSSEEKWGRGRGCSHVVLHLSLRDMRRRLRCRALICSPDLG